jgi:glycosyltransferase involved in cell wall biosynthesis
VGGNREVVVDGETGLLVPPGDLGGLAGAILRLARDPELRRAMGERAHARYEDLFTLDRMVDGYHSLLEGELRATR